MAIFNGDEKDDNFIGDVANDTMYGGAGNDTLEGKGGTNVLNGGVGNDTYIFDGTAIANSIVDTSGVDTVKLRKDAGGKYNGKDSGTVSINTFNSVENLDASEITSSDLILTGNILNNTITGGSGYNQLLGGKGNDLLIGGDGRDLIDGGDGNDTLVGHGGVNLLNGGAGNDTYLIDGTETEVRVTDTNSSQPDQMVLTADANGKLAGKASAYYKLSDYVEKLDGSAILGTALTLEGTSGTDILIGGGGNDTLLGGSGNDTLFGGLGDNVLNGGAGNADIYLIDGHETSTTIIDANCILDTVKLVADADGKFAGEAQNDYSIAPHTPIPILDAREITKSRLTLTGNDLGNTIYGGAGGNVIDSGAGNDTIYGGDGSDTMYGGVGTNKMYGGKGNDTYQISGLEASKTVIGEYGPVTDIDAIQLKATNGGFAGGTRFSLEDYSASIENLDASAITTTNMTLIGNSSNNYITGGAGDDKIDSGLGNDTLDGGAGVNTLTGGSGNDTYLLSGIASSTVIVESTSASAGGNDTVKLTADYSGASSVSLDGSSLNRNSLDNLDASAVTSGDLTLTGNDLANVVKGGAGKDTIFSGKGNDTLTGGEGVDTFKFFEGDQKDLVTAFTAGEVIDIDTSTGITTKDILFYYDAKHNLCIDYTYNSIGKDIVTVVGASADSTIKLGEDTISVGDITSRLDNKLTIKNKADQSTALSDLWGAATDRSGDDTYKIYGTETKTVAEKVAGGNDTLQLMPGVDSNFKGVTNLFPYGNYISLETLSRTALTLENIDARGITSSDAELYLFGNKLDNFIQGGAGYDNISTYEGNDTLFGGAGLNILNGGAGNDTYLVDGTETESRIVDTNSSQADKLVLLADLNGKLAGKATADYSLPYYIETLDGSAIQHTDLTLRGTSMAETFIGGGGNDTLIAGDGGDTLFGGAGDNTLNGGWGNDTYLFDGKESSTVIDDVNGVMDAAKLIADANGKYAGVSQNDFSLVDLADNTIEIIDATAITATNMDLVGNSLNNTIYGGAGGNVIDSGAGNDTIYGGDGSDTIYGGTGSNKMYGGKGNDTYQISGLEASKTIIGEYGPVTDVDTVQLKATNGGFAGGTSYSISDYAPVENLDASAITTTNMTLTGNSSNNYITGGAGDDKIDSGLGNDTLDGGAGANTLTGGSGNDTYLLSGNASSTVIVESTSAIAGVDTVKLVAEEGSYSGDTSISLDALSTYANSVENLDASAVTKNGLELVGNDLNNTIIGGDGISTNLVKNYYEYNSNGDVAVRTIYIYDEKGNELSKETFQNGVPGNSEPSHRREDRTYDANGNILSLESKYYAVNGSVLYDSKYAYTSKGEEYLVESKGYDQDGNLQTRTVNTVEFDSNDNITSSTIMNYDGLGAVTSSHLYTSTFDSNGNNIYSEYFQRDADGVTTRSGTGECTYDSKGNVLTVESIDYNGAGVVTYHLLSENTYDSKGNQLSYHDLTTQNGTTFENSHTYTYDVAGNQLTDEYTQKDVSTGNVTSYSLITSTYDAKGNMLTYSGITDYKQGDISRTDITYTYDSNGNQIGLVEKDYSNDVFSARSVGTYVYDSNGQKIFESMKTYDANGVLYADSSTSYGANYSSVTGADTLLGAAGNDTLLAGAGSDILVGGTGNDLLTGGTGVDTFKFFEGDQKDLVTATEASEVINIDSSTGVSTSDILFYKDASGNFCIDYTDDGVNKDVITISSWDAHTIIQLGEFSLQIGAVADLLNKGLTNANKAAQAAALASVWKSPFNNNSDNIYSIYGTEISKIKEEVGGGNDTLKLVGGANGVFTGSTDLFPKTREYDGLSLSLNTVVSLENLSTNANTIENLDASEISSLSASSGLILEGNALNNIITGSEKNDFIFGGAGNDTLNGGAGDDFIDGGLGSNTLVGGAGNDSYLIDGNETSTTIVDSGTNEIYLKTTNHVYAGGSSFVIGTSDYGTVIENLNASQATEMTITGSAGDNYIGIGGGHNKVYAGAGNDNVAYYDYTNVKGHNYIDGGDGNDTLAGVISDTIYGGTGNDSLSVADNGYLDGGAGNDSLRAVRGSSTMFGGAGDDKIYGGQYNVNVIGGTGNDSLSGTTGIDTYYFNQGDGVDVIASTDTTDVINIDASTGITKADVLFYTNNIGDLFVDYTKGGIGTDVIKIDSYSTVANLPNVELGGSLVDITAILAALPAAYKNLTATAIANLTAGSKVTQYTSLSSKWTDLNNTGNDLLNGTASADVLRGGEGKDSLFGGAGNDVLYGDKGSDTLVGGKGNDTLMGGMGVDTFKFEKGDGIDYITGTGDAGDLIVIDNSAGITTSDIFLYTDVYGNLYVDYSDGGIKTDVIKIAAGSNNDMKIQVGDKAIEVGHLQEIAGLCGYTSVSDAAIAKLTLSDKTAQAAALVQYWTDASRDNTYLINGSELAKVNEAVDDGNDTLKLVADESGAFVGSTGLFPDGAVSLDGLSVTANTIENIDGSAIVANSLKLTGNELNNVLSGGSKNDIINGGAGDDTIYGGDCLPGDLMSSLITYNASGNMVSKVSSTYDTKGNELTSENIKYSAGGSVTGRSAITNTYDADGNLLTYESIKYGVSGSVTSRSTKFNTYDASGHLLTSENINYGVSGSVTSRSVATRTYDASGHLLAYENINYGVSGNVTSHQTATNVYDESGNLLRNENIQYEAGEVITSHNVYAPIYDASGHLFSAIDTYYDAAGHVGSVSEHTYDENGNLTISTQTVYDANAAVHATHVCTNTYDQNNRLIISDSINYDAAGNLDVRNLTVDTYDVNGDLIKEEHTGSNAQGNVIGNSVNTLTYDGNHNCLTFSSIINQSGQKYERSCTYTYDSDGNQLSVTEVNQVNDILEGSSTILYTYDSRGNQLTYDYTAYDALGNITDHESESSAFTSAISDMLFGGSGNDKITASGGNDVIEGGAGSDTIYGGAGNDLISGGMASLSGADGADLIYGGDGNDTIYGNTADDVQNVVGHGDGNNTVYGEKGNDLIYSGSGNDYVDGGIGDDVIYGGLGNDTIYGGYDDNTVYGGAGNDTIYGGINAVGGTGTNYISGGAGNDTIFNFAGNGVIYGDEGDDVINTSTYANSGHNTIYGGAGNDTITGSLNETIYGGDGDDSITVTIGGITLDGGEGNDTILGGTSTVSVDTLYGGAGNDIINGRGGADVIIGGAGNDTLTGGTNADDFYFVSGDAIDTITATDTSDTIIIDSKTGLTYQSLLFYTDTEGNFYIDYTDGGIGEDVIKIDSYATAEHLPNIEIGDATLDLTSIISSLGAYASLGSAAIANLAVSDKATQFSTISGQWTLANQVVQGLLLASALLNCFDYEGVNHNGNDTYVIDGSEWQTFKEKVDGGGTDALQLAADTNGAFIGYTDLYAASNVTAIDAASKTSHKFDYIYGANEMNGAHYPGYDNVYSTSSVISIDALSRTDNTIENVDASDVTTSILKIVGNDLNNTIVGGQANDTIYGGAGNDTLDGNFGADTIYGGAGDDVISGSSGFDSNGYELMFVSSAKYGAPFGDNFSYIGGMPHAGANDVLVGGSGNDTYLFDGDEQYYSNGWGTITKTAVVEEVGGGTDTIKLVANADGSYCYYSGYNFLPSIDLNYLGATANTIENIDASAILHNPDANYSSLALYGNDIANTIIGSGGDDAINGYGGNDTIICGKGTDWFSGGSGADTFLFFEGDGLDTTEDSNLSSDDKIIIDTSTGITKDDLFFYSDENGRVYIDYTDNGVGQDMIYIRGTQPTGLTIQVGDSHIHLNQILQQITASGNALLSAEAISALTTTNEAAQVTLAAGSWTQN